MKQIASFQVDHTKFGIGMYISRIDDDIVTYDIRMVKPNGGTYLPVPAMHTIEHLFATYARSSKFENNIIYVGPMGCRTGFYLLTRGISNSDAIQLVKDSFKFISNFNGKIPGATEVECGNYKEHDLSTAKQCVLPLLAVLEDYSVEKLSYSYHIDK
ncbi:MAG: S-ribosylhomocysteine lyase [Ruminococcus sp.]|nr:S-ribosylhomocysteine lyase [Ruminococcus sp.]